MYRSGLDNEVIHFTARSQRILGRRYYAAYEAALVNYPVPPMMGGAVEAVEGSLQSMREASRHYREMLQREEM